MGWDEVHEDLMDQITAGLKFKCGECGIGVHKGYFPLCYQCNVEMDAIDLAWDEVHKELKNRINDSCLECEVDNRKGYNPFCYQCNETKNMREELPHLGALFPPF